jgi:UDP-N-acetylmuramyl tripeptide synthase
MKFKFYLSLIIARLAYFFLKVTKLSNGTAIIGLIALKICPDFLIYANEFITDAKINITGTNGKTTTSGIISHLIKKENNSLINNYIGANMLNGIVNTLALEINPFRKAKFSVIETDEAFLIKIYDKMNGDYLLVTNLFEDQTDRFANPLITRDLIQKGINLKKQVRLILNANDPIAASLTSAKEPIFYGIRNVKDENKNNSASSISDINCPQCGEKLQYEKYFYSHIGNFNCKCGYKTPNIKYLADVTLYENHSIINIADEEFNIPLTGLYNAYNALGAIALAKELGIENIQENLKTFKTAFGRNEKRILFEHETILQLIKNPAGTNEVLKTIDLNSNILIAINNNIADGTDISWINQVNFEILTNTNKEIIVTGICADSVADRLKKANVKNIKTIYDIKKAVEYIGKNANDKITILSSYTALLQINKNKEMKKCY